MSIQNGIKKRRGTWIKLYAEKWIYGSTRSELTNAERAVWVDLLTLAALNEPPGQVDFNSFRRLANQLNISHKLLMGCTNKALLNDKLRLVRSSADLKTGKKIEEVCESYKDIKTFLTDSVACQSKYGTVQFSLIILKWNRYQSEYLRQRPYREEKPTKETDESADLEVVTPVTDRGEERRGDEKRIIEKRGEDDRILSPEPVACAPFHPPVSRQPLESQKAEFLALLSKCFGYPFNQEQDSQLFDDMTEKYPEIDILEQTRKKIEWWGTHPVTLNRTPREQLNRWFRKEHEYQTKCRLSNRNPNQVDPYVGAQPPRPSDEEKALFPQWEAEYKTYLSESMKKNGLTDEEEIDYTRLDIETWTAFKIRKLKEYQKKRV